MSAEWTVLLLLSALVALNSIAVIVLIRRQRGTTDPELPRGPLVGARFDVGTPIGELAAGASRVVFCFVSPQCGHCREMLPEFVRVSQRERVVLVCSVPRSELDAHLAEQGIDLPVVSGPDVFDANDVPGPPYAVVTNAGGVVLAQSGANRPAQLTALLDLADALQGQDP